MFALALVAIWALADAVELSFLGWVSRGLPLLLIGFILGDAFERLSRAERHHVYHEARELRHRQAVEINDSLIQGMAAAKLSLEDGRLEAGLAALGKTLVEGQRLVSDLIRDADAAHRNGAEPR